MMTAEAMAGVNRLSPWYWLRISHSRFYPLAAFPQTPRDLDSRYSFPHWAKLSNCRIDTNIQQVVGHIVGPEGKWSASIASLVGLLARRKWIAA